LEQDQRRAHLADVRQRRARDVNVTRLRQRPQQTVKVSRLEVVCVRGEGQHVSHAIVRCAGCKNTAVDESVEDCKATSTAALDDHLVGVCDALLHERLNHAEHVLRVNNLQENQNSAMKPKMK
jgi:hypothetical protein